MGFPPMVISTTQPAAGGTALASKPRRRCPMRTATSLVIASPGLLLADAVLRPALAQTPAPSAAPATGSGGTIMAILLVVGLLVIIAAGVALIDLKRRRDAEAVH